MLADIRGLPWQPRDGIRHRVTPEVSHAVPRPLPAGGAAGGPAQGDEIPVEGEEADAHPTLAEDGQNLDLDGLTVEAAAQLEEVLGPDEEDGLPAGSPAEAEQSAPYHLYHFVERMVVTDAIALRRTHESYGIRCRREAGSTRVKCDRVSRVLT